MNNQNNNQNNGDNNGFFNKNPIFIFAIFAIVIVLAFRSFSGDGLGGSFGLNSNAQSKMVAYSEFKDMLKNKQLNEVAISETTIKGIGSDKTIYLAKRINDPTLIGILEQNGITYSVYSENNWFGDLIFSWIIPVFIFFAIYIQRILVNPEIIKPRKIYNKKRLIKFLFYYIYFFLRLYSLRMVQL